MLGAGLESHSWQLISKVIQPFFHNLLGNQVWQKQKQMGLVRTLFPQATYLCLGLPPTNRSLLLLSLFLPSPRDGVTKDKLIHRANWPSLRRLTLLKKLCKEVVLPQISSFRVKVPEYVTPILFPNHSKLG